MTCNDNNSDYTYTDEDGEQPIEECVIAESIADEREASEAIIYSIDWYNELVTEIETYTIFITMRDRVDNQNYHPKEMPNRALSILMTIKSLTPSI